jgi:hypothetical protein
MKQIVISSDNLRAINFNLRNGFRITQHYGAFVLLEKKVGKNVKRK